MDNISKYITYLEATRSDTAKRLGIDNTPDANQLLRMQDLATRIFEPIREHFGKPIYISSFFRSSVLNKALKGSTKSQHMLGEAIDLDADNYGGITNKEIFDYIKDNLEFDQLIYEAGTDTNPDWVHVSLKENNNRKEILRMKIVNNKKIYEQYV